jgi:hypothetical protein
LDQNLRLALAWGTSGVTLSLDEYLQRGVTIENPPRVRVFELCRFLADAARDSVLATAKQRRVSVPPDMKQILRLEEWHHPNVVDDDDRPSGSGTFQQLLVTGNVVFHRPSRPPNIRWRNWPN